ncbi:hypothetical protein ACLX1H_009623 [Fusarium chlamydosporum]
MDPNSIILENLRLFFGFSSSRAFVDLAAIEQEKLEYDLEYISEELSQKNIASIYMKWLIQQDFDLQDACPSKIVETWASFMRPRGMRLGEAIMMWQHESNWLLTVIRDPKMIKDQEPMRRAANKLRREIEYQFLKSENAAKNGSTAFGSDHGNQSQPATLPPLKPLARPVYGPERPPPSSNTSNSSTFKHNFSGTRSRRTGRREEQPNDKPGSAFLQGWPTRDIPFHSVEDPMELEQNEESYTGQSDTVGEQTDETSSEEDSRAMASRGQPQEIIDLATPTPPQTPAPPRNRWVEDRRL